MSKKLKVIFKKSVTNFVKNMEQNTTKEEIRNNYLPVLKKNYNAITTSIPKWESIFSNYFAYGEDINPNKIHPKLIILPRKKSSDLHKLFKVATMTWSVPLSNGFGRRIRGLVFDTYNEKLMGIFALGDPVYNRAIRDEFIGWNNETKEKNLINLMTSYILGAVPPYNKLKIGKYISQVSVSKEVVSEFKKRYHNCKGNISGERKNAQLIGVTNVTAFGKSSMMDRIYHPEWNFIGYSRGFGTSFFSDGIFDMAKELVREDNEEFYRMYNYGEGPNWKLRILRKAFQLADVPQNYLEIGNYKGIYFCGIAENWKEILLSPNFIKAKYPEKYGYRNYWKDFKPIVQKRSQTDNSWKDFDLHEVISRVKQVI
ncbi:MAG: DUF4338 domain-containing protein [Candidatus Heimdallarchaeota archaeon]|nr:DUF4338 domain-containing protein [Candidatus Heimdallarchaeota archaeon]MDH5644896.1 DUF4338 domain-containing protein [Candidatus Heimdallarchaeota archaeon]